MKERDCPCIDKNCSECCSPVKMRRFMDEEQIPKDGKGDPLWTKRRELLVPEDNPDGPKLEAYDCKNLDPETGKCRDYENRPDICKRSGCVNPESNEPKEVQFKRLAEKKYMIIK